MLVRERVRWRRTLACRSGRGEPGECGLRSGVDSVTSWSSPASEHVRGWAGWGAGARS